MKILIKGFRHIIKSFKKTKYILTLDADGELPVKNIPKIIKTMKDKKCDLVIATIQILIDLVKIYSIKYSDLNSD